MNDEENRNPEALLAQAQAGSEQQLVALLEGYRNYLAVLARLRVHQQLRTKVDDSDLIQETMLRAYQDFPRFRGTTEAEFLQWLRRIMATRIATAVRRYLGRQRRDIRLERTLEEQLSESSAVMERAFVSRESSPSARAARQERAVLLANAVAKLPSGYREVIIMHHFEGRTMAEVSRRTGRSLNAVQKSWSRGLIKLQRLLGDIE